MTRRRQSATPPTYLLAALVGAGFLAATAAACDTQPDAQYVGVCVDRATQLRVPDDRCGLYDSGGAVGGGVEWDYVDMIAYPTYPVPAYGARMSTTHVVVVHTVPHGMSVTRGLPRAGGTATVARVHAAPAARAASNPNLSGQGTGNSTVERGGFGGGKTATTGVSSGS